MRESTGVFRVIAGNAKLRRVAGAYALFIVDEYAVWIAMLVFAYQQGGASAAGLIVIAQTLPPSILAPVMATVADRRSPTTLLVGGYLAQAVAMGATAVALFSGVTAFAAYAAAVVASTAVATTRPAQAALLPGIAHTPEQLAAMNVVTGWMESLGIVLAGALTGVLLSAAGPGLVFAVCSALGVVATLLVAFLHARPLAIDDAEGSQAGAFAQVVAGLRLLLEERSPRLLVIVLALTWVVLGALDILFVVLALAVLHQGQALTGYLNMAFGIGGVLAASVTALLVGRRLGAPILAASVVLSAGIGFTAISTGVVATAALLALAGAGAAVLEVATRSLLQRTVPAQLLGRVFGVVEGVTMAGLAIGAAIVTVLNNLGGPTAAILGVAALLPLGLVFSGRKLLTLDAHATVPVVEMSLLRKLPHFAVLPGPALEGLARSLERVELPADTVLIREGEPGHTFYAIADGRLDVTIAGEHVRTLERGDGVGEIALLHNVLRTATVTTLTDATLYALDSSAFLAAVTGHLPTRLAVTGVADSRLAGDAELDAG